MVSFDDNNSQLRVATIMIRQFIIDEVDRHPTDISRLVQERFGLSRQAAARHLKALVDDGVLVSSGNTKARRYSPKVLARNFLMYDLSEDLAEHIIWREAVAPVLEDVPENVLSICNHGFTEMMNNAISHSEGSDVSVEVERSASSVKITVHDNGIGIFNKITREFKLSDHREALLELSKGRLTTDASQHSGEGIFFTSRMFDDFAISSTPLFYNRLRQMGEDEGWLIESEHSNTRGTMVEMIIKTSSKLTTAEVFDEYAASDDDLTFAKTHVPVKLAKYEQDQLISRSAAKRVLARFDSFKEVILDFQGVEFIGQAFADEIFRVYRIAHPDIGVYPIRMSPEVEEMVDRAMQAWLNDFSAEKPTASQPPS